MNGSNNEMKIRLLDELIEKLQMMEDGAPEEASLEINPEVDSSTEMSQEDDSEMKEKLAKMKGI